ncbi:MAG: bifunctional folylpolyglutamate synthase/dihydrofolate synthase [Pseudomonadota bacterium]|nr:bifunctional folylpolyglutamate synthase/dihydrofolate synthase [Pseudomonadota bacterium]
MTTSESGAVLERLARLHSRRIELDLERLPALLDRLGAPQRRLPPVVHVAGTNGKGSVLAFLAAMLGAAGLKVSRYVSPYLLEPAEQVLLPDGQVQDAVLAAALARVEEANDGAPLTSFEALTAAAFLVYSEQPADMLLLECGMGGRTDATNVIDRPELVAITAVDLDHMAFLGPDIRSIASEKAGILKPRIPVVASPAHRDAVDVIAARAASLAAPLYLAGRDFAVDPATGHYRGIAFDLDLPVPTLAGPHQWANAAQAAACAELLLTDPARLQGPITARTAPAEAIRTGVGSAVWPARLQRLADAAHEIWVDGGHNPHAARALVVALQAMAPAPLVLVTGMQDTRPVADFLAPFVALDPLVIGTRAGSQPAFVPGAPLAPDAVVAAARDLGLRAEAAEDPGAALERAKKEPAARILVAGSLYLAGDVLRRSGQMLDSIQL